MWSLYKNDNGEVLKPLVFSNGKTQENIVNEVLDAIKQGFKIIFIKGMCGTGKSSIALNIARKMGKTSIVVPIKSLQEQYIRDYTEKFYILNKNEKEKLKISSIVGRQNFKCKYIDDGNFYPIKQKSEKDMKLTDIFLGSKKESENKNNIRDRSCDNDLLPCKIEIKEKNTEIIKEYIKQNPAVKISDFYSISEVKRMTIAPVCPYWSPILPREFEIQFNNSKKIHYKGLEGQQFTIHQRKPGCSYYEQYLAYSDADVIIFNSSKYKIETLMNRKPFTQIEIIDECDEFLDSFANQEKISLNKLLLSLNLIYSNENKHKKIINELIDISNTIKRKYSEAGEVLNLKGTLIENLIKQIFINKDLLEEIEIDENSYVFHLIEVAVIFHDFIDESFFSVEKNKEDYIINLVTINLKKRFRELMDKNKVLLLMSGTLHSEHVLKNIFGLEQYKVIEAETKLQGDLIKCKNGYEIDCKYSNFQSEKVTRKKYLKSLSVAISSAKKPILIHLTSFSDLPTNREKEEFYLSNLPSQIEFIETQDYDPLGKRVTDFKNKKIDILFTTKCNRGIDFPGDTCNSIIISRFPYPNISNLFWKILKKSNPENFIDFYIDKANRELLQRIYRGLRSEKDRVYLLSPDIRVLEYELC